MSSKSPRMLTIIGSRVRDITVDVNLPDLYRRDGDLTEVIRFHGNDPIVQVGAHVVPQIAGADVPEFVLDLGESSEDVEIVTIADKDYYVLKGGKKYQLREPKPLTSPSASTSPRIELPCHGRAWGGGGLNMAVAMRGMSKYPTTPITYVDSARQLRDKGWYKQLLGKFVDAGPVVPKNTAADLTFLRTLTAALRIIPDAPGAAGGERPLPQLLDLETAALFDYFDKIGERGYRGLASLISVFDPLGSADFFLAQQHIRFAMLRRATCPTPANLVFKRVRDTSITIDDKIVFRGHRPQARFGKADALELLQNEVPDPGLIVINTVHDRPLFVAALEWAAEVQERQKEGLGDKTKTEPICPVLIVLGSGNLAHFDDVKVLEEYYDKLANLYVLFNESEFGDYIAEHQPTKAKEFIDNMKKGRTPDTGRLRYLFDAYTSTVLSRYHQNFLVTLGPLGSLGITGQTVTYVGTYAVPETPIYSTNGCGDAFAAGVGLLAYHKHNYEGNGDVPPGRLLPRSPGVSEFTLMMQLGTAAAYAKASNPMGVTARRDVEALLKDAYVPTAPPISFSDLGSEGPLKRPMEAHRVKWGGILEKILDA